VAEHGCGPCALVERSRGTCSLLGLLPRACTLPALTLFFFLPIAATNDLFATSALSDRAGKDRLGISRGAPVPLTDASSDHAEDGHHTGEAPPTAIAYPMLFLFVALLIGKVYMYLYLYLCLYLYYVA